MKRRYFLAGVIAAGAYPLIQAFASGGGKEGAGMIEKVEKSDEEFKMIKLHAPPHSARG